MIGVYCESYTTVTVFSKLEVLLGHYTPSMIIIGVKYLLLSSHLPSIHRTGSSVPIIYLLNSRLGSLTPRPQTKIGDTVKRGKYVGLI